MAASYSTGTAASPTALVQALVTWLVAQGWTQDASAADASGWRAHLHKGGLYVNLRSAMNESIWNYNQAAGYGVGLYLGDGYSGAANWRSQSGGPLQTATSNVVGAGMQLGSGAVTAYHFFDDGADHVTVVVEKSPGLFVHMGWGPSLVKTGYTLDFPYFYGSSPSYMNTAIPASTSFPGSDVTAAAPFAHTWAYSTERHSAFFVRVDPAEWAAKWTGGGYTTGTPAGYTGRRARSGLNLVGSEPTTGWDYWVPNFVNLWGRSWPTAYPGAMILPLHVFLERTTGRYAPVGYPPTVFASQASARGFASGSIWAVGGVNYMVFPGFVVKKAA